MSRKLLLEIHAVKFIAHVLGVDYQGVHNGTDSSMADGEIRYLGELFAVLEVTIDDDPVSEESDSIWLHNLDEAFRDLRVGSGSWRVGLQRGVRWNNLQIDDFQHLVDNMKLEGIKFVHSYEGKSEGCSFDICNRLGINNIDFMDTTSDGIYRSYSTEPRRFDDSGDPYPGYLQEILTTDKIKNKIRKLVDRASGTPAFLAIVVGSATELSARFGWISKRNYSSHRNQKFDLPDEISALYVLHLGAGHAIWFDAQNGWREAKIDERSVISLLQESLNERDKLN